MNRVQLSVFAAAAALALSFIARADDTASDKNAAVPAHQKHPLDTAMPAPKGTRVALKIGDQSAIGYVAKPAGEPKGTVLVIHEWWGLNNWIKHEADELASLGYLALAVDLYKGTVATTPEEAGKLMGQLDKAWAAKVERAGIEWLKAEAPKHKLATIGWCMGGGQSLGASLASASDVSATVIYYGMPVMDPAQLAALKGGAVLGLFAKKDGWITPDKVDTFDKALTQAGVPHEIHEYDADHAFANPSGGKHNPAAAQEAWSKTKAFLAAHLN
jgi:carboxymethylenebutenolidase